MILIDDRRGSAEPQILQEFDTYMNLSYNVCRLSSADFVFSAFGPPRGNGSDMGEYGAVRQFGFERKRLEDFIQSLETGRLQSQIAEMTGYEDKAAAFDFPFLIVEGIWRADSAGFLQVPMGNNRWGHPAGRRPFPVEKVENALTMLQVACGVRVQRTANIRETVAFIVRTYRLFQKPWTQHQMMKGFTYVNLPNHALFVEPTMVRLVSSAYPGIGWEKSAGIEEVFPSVAAFIEAAATNSRQLLAVKGIGPRLAQLIHRATILDRFKRGK